MKIKVNNWGSTQIKARFFELTITGCQTSYAPFGFIEFQSRDITFSLVPRFRIPNNQQPMPYWD